MREAGDWRGGTEMAGGGAGRWKRRTRTLEVAEVRVPGAGGAAGPGWGCGALEAWQGEEDAESWGTGRCVSCAPQVPERGCDRDALPSSLR